MENLKSTIKEIRADIKNWWMLLLVGILFIGIGILVLVNPFKSYVSLAWFFAVIMMVSGFLQKWFAIANNNEIEGWGWQLALGIVEFTIGLVLILNLDFTMAILPFYVGFWLLFKSLALIGFSFELKSYKITNWMYYLVFGILLTILSWFVILNPLLGKMTIVVWSGIALIVAGLAYVLLSFKLKNVKRKVVKINEFFS